MLDRPVKSGNREDEAVGGSAGRDLLCNAEPYIWFHRQFLDVHPLGVLSMDFLAKAKAENSIRHLTHCGKLAKSAHSLFYQH